MRILLCGRFDGGLIGGGAEVQLYATRDVLRDAGHEVEVLGPETTRHGDLVHFFGPYGYYWMFAQELVDRSFPYVASTIWYKPGPVSSLKALRLYDHARLRFPRPSRKLFKSSRRLLVPMPDVARRIEAYFGVPASKCDVVPSSPIDGRFRVPDPEPFRRATDLRDDFVLCLGNFYRRKNQLSLIRAVKGTGMKVLLVGRETDVDYARQCREEAGPEVTFYGGLAHSDPLLPSLLASARVVCQPSLIEDYLIAGLEASVAGTRLVLSDTWRPHEIYGDWPIYTSPEPAKLRPALEQAWDSPCDRQAQSDWYWERFSAEPFLRAILQSYEKALGG